MTFHPDNYQLWQKEYPLFTLWALRRDILFLPKTLSEVDEDKQWDLTSKAYILMKRLGQSYGEIMQMDASERDTLFEMEMKLIKEEAKDNKTQPHG